MDISFRKLPGHPALGIAFFWSLRLTSRRPVTLTDLFIPELYYDYFALQRGQVTLVDARGAETCLPPQTLRGLFTRPVSLRYTTPLVVFGARLALSFAEGYWEPRLRAQVFTEQAWVSRAPRGLAGFAAQFTRHVQARRTAKIPYPMLGPALAESGWLASYSARHKRRLYQSVYGLSRQALERVRGLEAFLTQACGFDERRQPTLLGHVNPEVFYDQPHFNRVFKQMTGLAPGEYFAAQSHLQANLMAASYNAPDAARAML